MGIFVTVSSLAANRSIWFRSGGTTPRRMNRTGTAASRRSTASSDISIVLPEPLCPARISA